MSELTMEILRADHEALVAGGRRCMGGCGKWLPTEHAFGERPIVNYHCESKACIRQICRIAEGLDPLEVIEGGGGDVG